MSAQRSDAHAMASGVGWRLYADAERAAKDDAGFALTWCDDRGRIIYGDVEDACRESTAGTPDRWREISRREFFAQCEAEAVRRAVAADADDASMEELEAAGAIYATAERT